MGASSYVSDNGGTGKHQPEAGSDYKFHPLVEKERTSQRAVSFRMQLFMLIRNPVQ